MAQCVLNHDIILHVCEMHRIFIHVLMRTMTLARFNQCTIQMNDFFFRHISL